MTAKVVENIKAQMALSGTGFVAIIDGVMNPVTFSTLQNHSAIMAFRLKGYAVLFECTEGPGCDCLVKSLGRGFPDVSIVPVTLTAVDRQKKG